ncbi:fumarylacetoacetate hydrolase family protein [Fodinicola acaciae]|uniref:fumarylacetoacetate hydrolase family protein n=1 Tax=Fodinicola acaciae TaxID=2681555 RepID=UPI0013D643C7|nr:fumarylacetoacetate hydrolase family protein [Fodinicola acaciae]
MDPVSAALGTRPGVIVAVHVNYRGRAAQRGRTPTQPSYFLKPTSSLSATDQPLVRPKGCELLGFEGEIALVIGSEVHRATPEEAWQAVRWVTAGNDAGVYDMRYADRGSNVRSKGGDGFTPLGVDLLPADGLDPGRLWIRTYLNGEIVQDDTTEGIFFSFGQLVADLSEMLTLRPGDVILTGTPAGASVAQPGDVIEVEVGSLDDPSLTTGRLRNPVVAGDEPIGRYGAPPKADDATRAEAYGQPKRALSADVREQLASVSVATLSSQLRKRGLNAVSIDGVHPLRPGSKVVGTARTLRYLPVREDVFESRGAGFNAQKQAIEAVGPGDVLVMEARGEHGSGTIGDILALRAHVRGAVGIVTDGGARDVATLSTLDIPVFAGVAHPAVLGRKHVPWESDVAIGCGGALVEPGDVIVGDDDGVLVIPLAIAAEVAADAVEQERQERFIVEQVRAGHPINGLYPLGKEWKPAYEKWVEK